MVEIIKKLGGNVCGSQIGTLSPSLTVMTGNLEERRRLPDSLRWVIREFRISALITTHRDTGAHKPGTHPLCLIFAIIRVSCLEKEREERQKKKERGRGGRDGGRVLEQQQQRRAGAATLLSQASTPLPGYPLTQTPLESLELQVSSGLFFFFFSEEDTSSYWYIRVVLK